MNTMPSCSCLQHGCRCCVWSATKKKQTRRTSSAVPMIKSIRVKHTKPRNRRKKSARVFRIDYDDGSVVYTPALYLGITQAGSARIDQPPVYCHPCLSVQMHIYYGYDQTTRCLTCANKIGENDTSIKAEVILKDNK